MSHIPEIAKKLLPNVIKNTKSDINKQVDVTLCDTDTKSNILFFSFSLSLGPTGFLCRFLAGCWGPAYPATGTSGHLSGHPQQDPSCSFFTAHGPCAACDRAAGHAQGAGGQTPGPEVTQPTCLPGDTGRLWFRGTHPQQHAALNMEPHGTQSGQRPTAEPSVWRLWPGGPSEREPVGGEQGPSVRSRDTRAPGPGVQGLVRSNRC